MPRWILHTILFLFGVALSGAAVYYVQTRDRDLIQARQRRDLVPNAALTTDPQQFVSASGNKSADLRTNSVFLSKDGASPATSTVAPVSSGVDEVLLRNELSRGFGHEELQDALDSGDLRSLQLLRSEFVESVPNYQTVLIPLLREWALERLVTKMDQSDWSNWPGASRSKSGQASPARSFVNQILIVNPNLGGYLETSAWLLHALSTATSREEVYDQRQGLKDLLRNADELMMQSRGRNQAVPILSPLIIIDPAFTAVFEQERCRVVSDALKGVSSLSSKLRLISSLDARHCDPNAYESVIETVQSLTASGSLALRAQFLDSESKLRAVDVFARRDDRVRKALAELYAVAAVDYLEQGRSAAARKMLSESIGLEPNLKSQEYVRDFFAQTSLDQTPERARVVLPVEEPVSSGSTSWFFTITLFAAVIFPVWWLFTRLRMSVATMGTFGQSKPMKAPEVESLEIPDSAENLPSPVDVIEPAPKRRAQNALIH